MNSLEALTRILARQSPKPRARRRSKGSASSTSSPEVVLIPEEDPTPTAPPVASTSKAAAAPESERTSENRSSLLSDEKAPDRSSSSASRTTAAAAAAADEVNRRELVQARAVNLVLNSLPVRVSVALLVCIRRFLARLLRLPVPPVASTASPSAGADDEHVPPPSYEAATRTQRPRSSWNVFRRRQKGASATATEARSEKVTPSPPPAEEKRVAVLSRPKTLVLDLDETLIHSTNNLTGLSSPSGKWNSLSVRVVEVVLDSKSVVYHVYKRPWVDVFLKKVAAWYTVVIFTASIQEYADPVIDWLDGGKGLVTARLFRESCDLYRGAYRKDLSVISKDLSKMCLVDNSPAAYSLNPANGIPIEGWVGDTSDEGLLDLLPLLDSLRFTSDVRRVLGLRAFSQQQQR